MSIRIIPRLDIKGPNLVKGIHLEGLRVLGKPEEFAFHYSESGADEIVYMDVVASLYGRNNLAEIIRRTSSELSIPLTVGGGLRTIDDIRDVLRAGADKVSLNTAAIADPEFIRRASNEFGSSTIVVSVEAIRQTDGSCHAFTDNGRQETGLDAFAWAVRAAELGAGEIMVTSVDREGTGTGFDLDLTRRIADGVPIPVIASGGAGRIAHVLDVIEAGCADAVCIAAILHYGYLASHTPRGEFFEGNVDFLRRGGAANPVEPVTLEEVKAHLIARGVACRPAVAAA
jgi:imidazole glycerol-phosphate synthase subunit HisF